jgi:hypothetical protein
VLGSLGLEAVPSKRDVWAPWLSYLPGAPEPAGVHTALPAGEAAGLRDRLWHSFPTPLSGALHCPLPEDWASATRPGHLLCGESVGTVAYVWAQLHERAFGACPVGDARRMAHNARADTAPSDCVLGIVAALDDLLLSGPGPAHHERARLLASCIQPRFGHLPAEVGRPSLPPSTISFAHATFRRCRRTCPFTSVT